MKKILISGTYFHFAPRYLPQQVIQQEEADLLNKTLAFQAECRAIKLLRAGKSPEEVQSIIDGQILEDWSFIQSISLDLLVGRAD